MFYKLVEIKLKFKLTFVRELRKKYVMHEHWYCIICHYKLLNLVSYSSVNFDFKIEILDVRKPSHHQHIICFW
jgi:hypothetical protein